MSALNHTCHLGALLIAVLSAQAFGARTDFETTPAGLAPTDDAALTSAYSAGATGVEFGFDSTEDLMIDTSAHFELRDGGAADTVNAYKTGSSNAGPRDGDSTPGGAGGAWVLRAPGNFGDGIDIRGGADFLIRYAGTLPTSASGQIWDLDGISASLFERWRVEALDSAGAVIATQDSPFYTTRINPPGDSRDGWPWTFSFDGLSAPIQTIRISWTGEIGGFDIGFAFDNFDATAAAADQDADGIDDDSDNCLAVANPGQRDTDADGIGNICDADFNQDCVVDFLDLGEFKSNFFAVGDTEYDLNSDGTVDFLDLGLLKAGFFSNYTADNPSGVPNACDGS